jgi:hypothetical protein
LDKKSNQPGGNMFKHNIQIVFAILLISLTTNYAQGKFGDIGKFLKSSDANILFGKPVASIPISTEELTEAIRNAKDYILFSIKNNKVTITNERRKTLTRNSRDAGERDVMFFFSKSIISSLVNYAGNSQIYIEQRPGNINTITIKPSIRTSILTESNTGVTKNGNIASTAATAETEITLEMANICPPICFE